MRHAAYLGTSRHGIYFFRWPIPADRHPQQRRTDVRVSLGTRCPRSASRMSRRLVVVALGCLEDESTSRMTFADIREHVRSHFQELLRTFKAGVAVEGPRQGIEADALRASEALSEGDPASWAGSQPGGADGLVAGFCARRDIKDDLTPQARTMLVTELHRGYRAYLQGASDFNASFGTYDLSDTSSTGDGTSAAVVALHGKDAPKVQGQGSADEHPHKDDGSTYAEVAASYLLEVKQHSGLAEKTLFDKQEAVNLLGEITGDLPVQSVTRADVRRVKSVLLRLPKNRSKSASTSGLSIQAMLELPDVERLSARTVNVYLGNMQSFFKWAVDNGHATENVFTGSRVKVNKSASDSGRTAFSPEAMRTMLSHLIENPVGVVRKDTHKWGSLIAAYTGMRLNEVAQLHVCDVKQVDGVWLFDVTAEGSDTKRLKNISSHRRVPVHDRLLELGLLDFVKVQSGSGAQLFPDLPYSEKNGYGRNLGRWFNESFLDTLMLSGQGLSFHCLRHTVVTRLSQSDVPEVQVKAIVGHTQSGVTYNTYFKEGFRPAQLRTAINRLAYD